MWDEDAVCTWGQQVLPGALSVLGQLWPSAVLGQAWL